MPGARNMSRLENQVAIITGGAQGIGFATAQRFGQEGASLVIADANQEGGLAAVEKLRRGDINAVYEYVDVTNTDSIAEMVGKTVLRFDKIDILVNNAGITGNESTLRNTEMDVIQRIIAVNLLGPIACAKEVIPTMIEHGYGRILNAASIVGRDGNFGQPGYSAAKGGLIAFTKTLAKELGPKGITVNAVAPGFTNTEMLADVPSDRLDAIVARTPVRRLGNAGDIANLYAFLASPEASFINGGLHSIDGGLTL